MDVPAHLPPPPAIADDWALFLDVDGTLLQFAGAPDAVEVPPGLVDVLAALQQRLGGALALVSGRPLAQLDALFAPLRLPSAGLHGLERRHADNHVDPPTPPVLLGILKRKAELLAERFPGALVEDRTRPSRCTGAATRMPSSHCATSPKVRCRGCTTTGCRPGTA